MKKYIAILLATLLANIGGSASAGILLFERSLNVDRSVNIFSTDQFDLDITLGDSFFSPSDPVTLFDDLEITPSDVGNVFEILANNPILQQAQQRLTDAQDEFIRLILAESQPGGLVEERGSSESGFFLGLPGPDLAGAIIERISLEITQFTLIPGSSSSAITTGPPVDLQLNVSFFGQPVPEPSGLWLLWSGLATLLGIKRPRKRQLAPVPVPTKKQR